MNRKILIVEDNNITSLSLKLFLEDSGHEVVKILKEADDLQAFVKDLQPDIILLDIILKNNVDGLQLAQKLRQKDINTPILFISALSDQQTLETIQSLSHSNYIVKPYDYSILAQKIEELTAVS